MLRSPLGRNDAKQNESVKLTTPIPAVSRLRSFADSPAMAANPVQVLSKYGEQLGDTFRFYLGGLIEATVTTNPAVIQHVLKTNADNYHKSDIQVKRMGHFLGKGLLTTHGEPWKIQRRLIQKGFDRRQLEALSSIMQDSLAESLRATSTPKSDPQAPSTSIPSLMKMTFAMVARSLFGARLKDEDIDLVSDTICTVQEFIVRQTIQPYLNPWFAVSGELRHHEDMRARADGVLMEYIKRRRNEAPGHDLLQTLMDARYSDGQGMPDELVLSESMQLLVAGHETSSNGLSWILYLLSSRLRRPRQSPPGVLLHPRRRTPQLRRRHQVRVHHPGHHGVAPPLPPVLDDRSRGSSGRPSRRHRHPRRLDGHRLRLRSPPRVPLLARPRDLRPRSLHSRRTRSSSTLSSPIYPSAEAPAAASAANYAMLRRSS